MQEAAHASLYDVGVTVHPDSYVAQSWLQHVQVGPGCRIIGSQLQGSPSHPIVIDANTTLIGCQLVSMQPKASFRFGAWEVAATGVHLHEGVYLEHSRVENSTLGAGTRGVRCSIVNSELGARCKVRNHSSLVLTKAAHDCHVGSEISKSVLAAGFVSERTASYLSLVAPGAYPTLDEAGLEQLLDRLPNLTNIGAGTVFANYSGKPRPAKALSLSPGSQKGTAVVYGAFSAVNSVIVNRYGQPSPEEDPFALLRRRDLTVLGLGSFVERKVTGRIPAFSYAGSPHPHEWKLGWVLERQPGIVLNIIKKMRKQLGDEAHRLQDLIEGTLRLELKLLEEEQTRDDTRYSAEALSKGIALFQQHLDGRWALDEQGQFMTPWHYNETLQRWAPQH